MDNEPKIRDLVRSYVEPEGCSVPVADARERAPITAEGAWVRGGPMMWWGSNGGWAGWLFMALMMVAVWGLLIVAIVWLVRATKSSQGGDEGRGSSNAVAILEERLARGEIDRDEFEQRRAALHGR